MQKCLFICWICRKLEVISITDLDPAGYSIQKNLVARLKKQGLKVGKVARVVGPEIFPNADDVKWIGFPVVRYKIVKKKIIPLPPTNMSQITKAKAWLKSIKDARFMTDKKVEDGKLVTIWGIEGDSADRKKIREIINHVIESRP